MKDTELEKLSLPARRYPFAAPPPLPPSPPPPSSSALALALALFSLHIHAAARMPFHLARSVGRPAGRQAGVSGTWRAHIKSLNLSRARSLSRSIRDLEGLHEVSLSLTPPPPPPPLSLSLSGTWRAHMKSACCRSTRRIHCAERRGGEERERDGGGGGSGEMVGEGGGEGGRNGEDGRGSLDGRRKRMVCGRVGGGTPSITPPIDATGTEAGGVSTLPACYQLSREG